MFEETNQTNMLFEEMAQSITHSDESDFEEEYDIADDKEQQDEEFGEVKEAGKGEKEPEELFDDQDDAASSVKKEEDSQPQELFRVKYNGKEYEMTRDEIIMNAQKGMNYDHVVSERDALRGNTEENMLFSHQDEQVSEEQAAYEKTKHSFMELHKAYPGLDIPNMPEAVYMDILAGQTPLSAYQAHENRILKEQISAVYLNEKNKAKALSKANGDGPHGEEDEFISGLFG